MSRHRFHDVISRERHHSCSSSRSIGRHCGLLCVEHYRARPLINYRVGDSCLKSQHSQGRACESLSLRPTWYIKRVLWQPGIHRKILSRKKQDKYNKTKKKPKKTQKKKKHSQSPSSCTIIFRLSISLTNFSLQIYLTSQARCHYWLCTMACCAYPGSKASIAHAGTKLELLCQQDQMPKVFLPLSCYSYGLVLLIPTPNIYFLLDRQ